MPAKKSTATKRKALVEGSPNGSSGKKTKTSDRSDASPSPTFFGSDPLRTPHPFHQEAEANGIVLRKYYPPEMSTARARAYTANELPRPIEALNAALADTATTRRSIPVRDAVVHWFKTDLRVVDNSALHMAGVKAREASVPVIGLYVVSPQDWDAHFTAPARVDFVLRALEKLRDGLAERDIPLWVETVDKRWMVPKRILELMNQWGAAHLFANIEYEVDELRREVRLVRMAADRGIALEMVHDTCVVAPGQLASGTGKQYAVYTPWFKAWVHHIHLNLELLELIEPPGKNSESARQKFGKLFDCKIPEAPEGKKLNKEEQERFRALWPAGEQEAMKLLDRFCENRIGRYADDRNFPSEDGTSSLSVHLASGTLSARTAVRTARDRNNTKRLDGGSHGIQTWISEIAWRDFYRHVLANWPYVCMNKPFKPEYANITWSYNLEHFEAWTSGRTGFPIVDAAMRQLTHVGWMHNRCRMIVASFLAKDLLIDWRMGERWFMEHLIDGDFASNNGGWGFSASVGVDPQPYFRVFNPLLQSEKFDPDGDYIRKWVPELRGIDGKAIHDPYGRGKPAEAREAGYPEAIVDHKGCRERALKAYKDGIGKDL